MGQSSQETIPMGAPSLVSAVLPLLGLGILTLLTPQKAQGVILDRFGAHQLSDNLMSQYNPETRFMRYVPLTSSRSDRGDVAKPRPAKRYLGIDIPDYVTVRSRERPGQFREDIIKRMQERG